MNVTCVAKKITICATRGFAAFHLAILVACTTLEEPTFSLENEQLFGEQPELISEDQIHQLGPLQQQAFLNYFNDPSRSEISTPLRVANYLKSKADRFTYSDEVLTAEQILRFGRGNCLSAPILTTAFARLIDTGLRYNAEPSSAAATPQNVRGVLSLGTPSGITPGNRSIFRDTFPIAFSRSRYEADLVFISFSDISDGSTFYVNFFPQECPRQPDHTAWNITYDEYLSLYYLHLANAAFAKQDYVEAYWLNSKSIELNSNNSLAYNNMAAIHRQLGDEAKAELIYQYGIEHLQDKLILLENYQTLLREQGRLEEAETIGQMTLALLN